MWDSLLSSIPAAKRNGETVAKSLMHESAYDAGHCNLVANGTRTLEDTLDSVLDRLELQPSEVM